MDPILLLDWVVQTLPSSEPAHIVLAVATYLGYRRYKDHEILGKNEHHLKVMKSYPTIDSRLRELCYETNSDQATLLEIHNGLNNIGDIATLKISMRNQGSRSSAILDGNYISNTPLGFYSTLFSEILDGSPLVIPNIEDSELLDQDKGLKNILKSKGVYGLSLYPIKGLHGLPFAVGMLVNSSVSQKLSEENIIKASQIFDQCGGMLLSLRKK